MVKSTYEQCLRLKEILKDSKVPETISDPLLTTFIEKHIGADPQTIRKYKVYMVKFRFLKRVAGGGYILGDKA